METENFSFLTFVGKHDARFRDFLGIILAMCSFPLCSKRIIINCDQRCLLRLTLFFILDLIALHEIKLF